MSEKQLIRFLNKNISPKTYIGYSYKTILTNKEKQAISGKFKNIKDNF